MFSSYKTTNLKAAKFDDWTDPVPAFGQNMREQEFQLNPAIKYFNQGSYGTTPRRVVEAAQLVRQQIESNPNSAVRQYPAEWDRVAQMAADFVGADVGNIAFCNNTTTGMANALNSYPFQDGDVILLNNLSHYAIRNQTQDIVNNRRPGVTSLEMVYPTSITSTEEIIQQYETILTDNPNIKLAIVDHISSQPAILFPVKEIVATCHAHNVDVAIDGAHAPAHVPLNLEDIGAEFYLGNIHKWAFAVRGCTIQYVAPKYHETVFPSIRSDTGTYPEPFKWQGTDDQTKYFTVETALQFIDWVGGYAAIAGYASSLYEYLPELVEAWGTGLLPIPTDMECPLLRMVRVPDMPAYEKSVDGAERLANDLIDLYGIWVPVKFYDGENWVRIAASIFLAQADLVALKDAVLELQAQTPQDEPQIRSRAKFQKFKFDMEIHIETSATATPESN